MKKIIILGLVSFHFLSCSSDDSVVTIPLPVPIIEETMYFPAIGSDSWETKSLASLNWNSSAVQPLLDFLTLKNSKSFIVLVNGRIVMENYFNGHTANSPWY